MKRGVFILLLISLVSCATLPSKRDNLSMARMFREKGDNVRSAIFYIRVTEENPKSIEALSFLYKFYLSQGDSSRAFELLLRLSSLEPEYPGWHFEIGKMLIKNGDKQEGCKELRIGKSLEKKLNTSPKTVKRYSNYNRYLEVCGK